MNFTRKILPYAFLAAIFPVSLFSAADAQTKRRTKPVQKAPVAAAAAPEPSPTVAEPQVKQPPKKNERPTNGSGSVSPGNGVSTVKAQTPNTPTPVYFYEFAQPDFIISQILIEHDEAGRGKISFVKRGSDQPISDPIELSRTSLERLKASFATLNFLDSNDNYQYEKDYSHLGNMKITLKTDGRARTATFNYTTNKDAKALVDEYRKIGNQFIWNFDISVARENQPLEAPKLLDSLDVQIRRNEISDPKQMVPLLQGLSNDERIPLIARNHATKLIKQIEKEKK